ncbi:porin family protein [Ekhidna sp.]|uniref:porin family protein n=1 Tax=Ekhidna sp. TaxID=2608089 RepID=UPI003B5A86EE
MIRIFYVILVLGSLSAYSQKSGFKGGLNIGNEKATQGGNSATATAKLSFMLGVYTEAKLSEQFFLSPELVYSIDGGKTEGFGDTFTDNFSYLSVPLMLKYYATEKFNLHVGPQLGFLLTAKVKSSGGTADITSSLKKTNFSMAFGGEGNLGSVNLGLRMILGLTDIANDEVFGDVEYRLNTIQIYLAVPF